MAVVWSTAGVPQIVPLLVPKLRPLGKVALISHDVMSPEPVSVAFNGKSLLCRPKVSTRVLGVYDKVGTSSFTVMLMLTLNEPPVLLPYTV